MPDDQITADIVQFLFLPGEEPIFIDRTASIEEIASDPTKFLRSVSEQFGIALGQEHRAMTVPQLAAHIRSVLMPQ
jgi:hypothetical protein